MDFPEQVTPQAAFIALVGRRGKLVEYVLHVRATGADIGFEGGERGMPFPGQPVAPALGAGKQSPAVLFPGAARREQRAYRLGIDVAHELADELLLPANGPVCRHALKVVQRFLKAYVQRKRLPHVVRELCQRFAERLEFELRPLALALAGLCVGHRLSYLAFPTEYCYEP